MRNVSNFTPQRGQVLPLVAMFLLIIAATTLFMYNSGQLVQEKIRLTNAADASVYGGAIRVARMSNFTAYTNRAMVMNSMAIAHAAGFASWLEQTARAVETLADIDSRENQNLLRQVYPAFMGGPGRSALQNRQRYQRTLMQAIHAHSQVSFRMGWAQGAIMDAVEPEGATYRDYGSVIRYIRKLNRLNYALDHATYQQGVNEGDLEGLGGSKAEEDYAPKLLPGDKNPDSDVVFDFNWQDTEFQKRMAGEPLDRMIEVTKNERKSKDFLTDRGWDWMAIYQLRTPYGTYPIPGWVKKRGSTELLGAQGLGWGALDSESVHWFGAAEQPLGYGHAYTHQDIEGIDNNFAGSRSGNPQAHRRARNQTARGFPSNETVAPWGDDGDFPIGAIPNYGQLGGTLLAKSDPIFYITARSFRKMSATRTIAGTNALNSNSVKPAGRLDVYEGNLRENKEAEYSVIASAEVIFDRPEKRADGRHELGSLFNPYWHAQLVNVSDEHRRRAQESHNKNNGLSIFVR